MSEFVDLFLSVGVAAALGGALFYNGEADSTSRTAVSIILLSVLVLPLISFISQLSVAVPKLPELPSVEGGEYAEVAEAAFCDGIADMLAQKYSLSSDAFGVKCYGFDLASMRAEEVIVTLREAAVRSDPLAVEKFINSYGIGVCHAEIGI